MKISILSVGTRGDVQPCVALAKQLVKDGLDVILVAHKEYKNLVEENNISFEEMPGNAANRWDNKNGNEKINIWEELENYSKQWIEKSLEVCKGSSAILFTPLCFIGPYIAEYYKIPSFSIMFEPNIPTKYQRSPFAILDLSFLPFFNKLTYFIGNQSFWFPMRKRINRLRTEILNLPPYGFWGSYKNRFKNEEYICTYSVHLSPKQKDWGENIFISGYWFLENEQPFELSEDLQEFLDNDKKPILLDMGSFSHEKLHPKLKMIIGEINESNKRLLIYPGKIDKNKYEFPEETYFLESNIPHAAILNSVKIFITHGGVGAIHAAMKFGVPIIPISLFGAQFFWGRALYKKGLGAKPLTITKLKPNQVSESIKYIQNSNEIFTNTAAVKLKIQNEDSCKLAVDRITKIIN